MKTNSTLLRPEWPRAPQVHALTSLRRGAGVSRPPFDAFNLGMGCGDDAIAVGHNRAWLIDLAELPSPPCWLRQVHGTGVHRFVRPESQVIEADAAVTSEPDVVLAILTADCLPVLFCADDGREIAAAHAGWRGLAGGVLEATLAAMHTPPAQVSVWLGPAAGPAQYEIGDEVRQAFVGPTPGDAAAFVATRPGHYLCDLYALARARLRRLGVASIRGGEHCTIGDPSRFFSHRRDGRTGRMVSLIWRGNQGS